MRRILHAGLLTSAVVAGAMALVPVPACAQMGQMGDTEAAISFDSFQDQLAPFGYWLYSDRWGVVWQPADVPYDFQPYSTAGHWVYTDDYGWYWASEYAWGDVPFHYGRWVNDPEDGWMWIPGYVWSPGWVAWRRGGSYIGWMPLPPDDAFLEGRGDIGISLGGINVAALYARWYGPAFNESRFARNWVFVSVGDISLPDYRRVVIRDPVRIINIIHQTRNVTNYTVVNNFVVNRSIDVHVVERAAGHPIPVVRAATVIRHPNLVASVAVGQRVQLRMRDIAPRGRGIANSAPPPPPRVVAKLSVNVTPRNGHAPVHLFTKATVTAPEAQTRFHGAPVRAAPGQREPGGAMQGPNTERMRSEQPGGMTGPNGERTHERQPGGAMGPAGEQQPNGMTGPSGERTHVRQPSGAMGPTGEQQPNGMTGPNGERTRERQPSGVMGPNSEQQPNGMTGPSSERTRERQPSGAVGPNSEQQPNGMTGPSSEPVRRHQPSGENGPSPEKPNATPPENAKPQAAPPQGSSAPDANGATPTHKKKKPPPENPPQNPPQ